MTKWFPRCYNCHMSQNDILMIFSSIGIIDTLYLIYHKVRGTDVACPIFPKEWCRTVQYSTYSKTLGIPNSFAGFGMYVAILVLIWLFSMGTIPLWPIKAIVTFGFLFSLYFTYIQGFVLKAFCTWCVISAINFLIMFIVVWFMF